MIEITHITSIAENNRTVQLHGLETKNLEIYSLKALEIFQ